MLSSALQSPLWCLAAALVLVAWIDATSTIAAAAAAAAAAEPTARTRNCVEEFGQCVTNRDCCDNDNSVECVTGDWKFTTDSTCLSKRSLKLEALAKEHGLHDHQTLTVLLKHFIYQHPEIREPHLEHHRKKNKHKNNLGNSNSNSNNDSNNHRHDDAEIEIDPLFYETIAKKYRHDIPKLVASLERKYQIRDAKLLPTVISEFLDRSRDTELQGDNLAEVLEHGIPQGRGRRGEP